MHSEWTHSGEEVLTSICGNNVARLIPSSEGPKLLINREEYSLKESCWDVEMFHGKNSSMLIFYWKGEVKLSIKFAPLSDLFCLHSQSTYEDGQPASTSGSHWSRIETFLMRLYQCLSFKSRTIQPI
jgi:hypothetical protein